MKVLNVEHLELVGDARFFGWFNCNMCLRDVGASKQRRQGGKNNLYGALKMVEWFY